MRLQGPVPLASPLGSLEIAEALLAEGLPFDLNTNSAQDFSTRCDHVLTLLADHEDISSVKLRTAQVMAQSHFDPRQAMKTAETVIDSTQNLDDDISRAYALTAWNYAHSKPEHSEQRAANALQVLELADKSGEYALYPASYVILLIALLEQGNIRSLDVELLKIREARTGLEETGHAHIADWFECLRSILDGDTESAEAQADANYLETTKNGNPDLALYTTQKGMIRWMRGEIAGAEEGFLAARRAYPDQLLWTVSLVWLWLAQGRRSAALSMMKTLPKIDDIPEDRYWLSTMTVLAEIARLHGSRELGESVKATLEPHAKRLVPVGVGVAFWGTCARSLGLLEESLGLLEDARQHLELAVDMSARVGAMAWHAEAQIELAEFALRHDLSDIPAHELLTEARLTCQARNFPALARRSMQKPKINALGRFEVVSMCGNRAEWSSRKARDLLKMLIAARGTARSREVYMHALWPDEAPESLANRFSVALNVIRRALDPEKLMPTQHHVVTEGDAVYLATENVNIDLEQFLTTAQQPDDESRRKALALYRGDAFSEDPYSDWANNIREHARRIYERLDEPPSSLLS